MRKHNVQRKSWSTFSFMAICSILVSHYTYVTCFQVRRVGKNEEAQCTARHEYFSILVCHIHMFYFESKVSIGLAAANTSSHHPDKATPLMGRII